MNPSRALILRWLFITVGIASVTVLGGMSFVSTLPKTYSAQTIYSTYVPTLSEQASGPGDVVFKENQNMLMSPDLLLPIIQNFGLAEAWTLHPPSKTSLSDTEAVAYLQKNLAIAMTQTDNGYIFKLTVSSNNPLEAAGIANALVDALKKNVDVRIDKQKQHSTFALQEQIDQQEKIVAEKKAALGKMHSTDAQSPRYLDAKRDLDDQQGILDVFMLRLKELKIDWSLHESPIHILSRAVPPVLPSNPNIIFAFIISIISGLILGGAVATFTTRLKHSR